MVLIIDFPALILDGVAQDLYAAYPEEGCGFLAGYEDDVRKITAFLPVSNVRKDNRSRRFEIDPLEFMRAEQWADDAGLTLLGVYHSHPDHPAIPSQTDLDNALPWFSYLILSVGAQGVLASRSWRLNDAGAFEEELIMVGQTSGIPSIH